MDKERLEKQKDFMEKIREVNKHKNLHYYILTLGCQLNENDSEKLCGIVEKMGYTKTDDIKIANLYIINTCCIRENAEEKVFGKLRRIETI